MRANRAKQRMLEGKPSIGAGAALGSVLAVEEMSRAGFDHVLVDLQHGAWDEAGARLAVRSICMGSATPMARVGKNDFAAIGRLLDGGMLGIVVPMVNSRQDAEDAVAATLYPPRGRRSVGAFGAQFYDDYAAGINDEVFLAVQIETEGAVERAEEILAVDGVDGCWIGPADLALSMGVDPATDEGRQTHERAILRVLEACRQTGKLPGIAAVNTGRRWLDHGFLFVTVTSDFSLIREGASNCLQELKSPHEDMP